MSKVIGLPMPEAGAEREVIFSRNHGCKNAPAFRRAMNDSCVDELVFTVGTYGEGMPSEVPFVVTSLAPCNVCGAYVSAWFEWKSPGIVILGKR